MADTDGLGQGEFVVGLTADAGDGRRRLGVLAWSALEALVAASADGVVPISVRGLAGQLGVAKATAAGALARLTDAGAVAQSQSRAGGRYSRGQYELDAAVCQRLGVVAVSSPCTSARGTAIKDTDTQATVAQATVTESAPTLKRRRRDDQTVAAQSSLFDLDAHTQS